MTETAPLPNSSEARTADGTLKDAQQTTSATQTTEPTTSSTQSQTNDTSTDTTQTQPTVPESYTFKPFEGQEVSKDLADAATPLFKELNLTQPQVDKLVDFWNTQTKKQTDLTTAAIKSMGEKWEAETKADKELGSNLPKVTAEIGRAFDALGDPAAVTAFKQAMDLTMAGNNPAIIRLIWKMAQRITEGTHVSGAGPSTAGQTKPGQNQRPSIAQAMYPTLSGNQ